MKTKVSLLFVFLLVGCAQVSTPVDEDRYGGRLSVAFPASPQQLDPGLMNQSEVYAITAQVYDNLVRVDEQLAPQPQLATSWEVSDDGLTWIFNLRDDVKFHHGTSFTADDVVFTFSRILDPEFGSSARSLLEFVREVVAVDEHTVEFKLNSPNSDLPTIFGGVQMRIVPHDFSNEQISQEPSGTGPFLFTQNVPGERVTLTRNPNYWGTDSDGNQLPYLDEVEFLTIPEAATRTSALLGGEVGVLWQIGLSDAPVLEKKDNVRVLTAPSGLYLDLAMREDQEPFTDVLVRRAMKLVVDRQQMLDIVGLGFGQPANDQPVAPIHEFYGNLPIPQRDVEKARELLSQAGYPDGIDVTLWTSNARPGMNEMAQLYQQQAEEAGINVTIEEVPADGYWDQVFMVKSFFMSSWTFRPTTDETLVIAHSSTTRWNETGYTSPEVDRFLNEARAEQDPAKRQELYTNAQRIIAEEGGSIIPFYRPHSMAVSSNINGFLPHPTTWLDFRTTWIDK